MELATKPAKISRPLKSKLDAKEGDEVVFECCLEGDGDVRVEWFKDGVLLKSGKERVWG